MFIQFTVGNYLSFKENTTFSMVGTKSTKEHEQASTGSLQENIFWQDLAGGTRLKMLKTAALYAANGGGKSNFLSALHFFKSLVLQPFSEENKIRVMPFLLDEITEKSPSFFELTFAIEGIQYRYGFEVDSQKVHSEWLFQLTSSSESTLFIRDGQHIKLYPRFKEVAKGLEKRVHGNILFLSWVAFNSETNEDKKQINVALFIRDYLRHQLVFVADVGEKAMSFTIKKYLSEVKFQTQLVEFFKSIKIGFEGVDIKEQEDALEQKMGVLKQQIEKRGKQELMDVMELVNQLQSKMRIIQDNNQTKSVSIEFKHRKTDAEGKLSTHTLLDLGLQSKGTQKLFGLLGLWIDAMEHSKMLIVDELDASLHTLLTQQLILLFQTPANKGGQLLFAAHDTNLLRKELLRRDQIWFAEKNEKTGASSLYSLVEYKEKIFVRNDASFAKGYLEGRYGAIPFVGDIHRFISEYLSHEATSKA